MNNRTRRATWVIDGCMISCERKITSLVLTSNEKDKAPGNEVSARVKSKPGRGKPVKSKRA